MRSLRIVKERYGPAGRRLPLGDSARFGVAAPSATERTAVSAAECSPCMRTAEAISGRERQTGLWRWKPGPPKLYPMPDPVPEIHALIEGDNGALLIAMRGGIRQLVDGKAEAYPLPGVGAAVHARSGCSGIAMAVCGSERRTGASCMCTREGRMCLRSLTVSQAITSTVSLRIVKAIFGSPPSMASTAFATLPSPRFLSSKVCPTAAVVVRSGGQGWQRLAWHS